MAEIGRDNSRGSISIAFVREAARALARRGLDPGPFLVRSGIPPGLLRSDSARVTPESFGKLWLGIAAALDDEFFGLDARRMKVGSFTTLCLLCLGAGDLREVLRRMCRCFKVLLDDTRVSLQFDRAGAALVLASRPMNKAGVGNEVTVFAHETVLVMAHGLMCWLAGRRVPVRSAQFAYARPAWWPEYHAVFCADLRFGAADTRLRIGARWLEAAVVQDRASARAFLRGAPANFILKYRGEQSLAARVRRRLRGLPPESWPTQEALARELRLGASTLHRKLEREGASFRAIKETLRRDLAIRHLTESAMSVTEVAAAVGFAEPSAFRRAFRQWTGLPPGAYRLATLSGRGAGPRA
jgi:AraC-like DNA-binding protein